MKLKASILFAKSLIFPRTNKKSTARKSIFGALICIGLSIIPLIIVLSVTNGMINGMTERFIELSSSHLQGFMRARSEYRKSLESFEEFSTKFYDVKGVKNCSIEINDNGLVSNKEYRHGCSIRAVDFNDFFNNPSTASLLKVQQGIIPFDSKGQKKAVIGSKIAELLNLKPGDKFNLITNKKSDSELISPKRTSLTVEAVVSSGYQEIDALWVFIPIETGFNILSNTSSNFLVKIRTEDAFSPDLYRIQSECDQIGKKELIAPRDVSFSKYRIFNWQEMNQSKLENFESTKIMLLFIMLLILLVASINISSALIMLIKERQKEIAIVKSLGGTSSGITISFVITGIFCSLGGILIGVPIGLLCSININSLISFIELIINNFTKFVYILKGSEISPDTIQLLDPAFYLSEVPVNIPYFEIFLSCVFVLVLAFIVSLIPSLKAGKERPLDTFSKN